MANFDQTIISRERYGTQRRTREGERMTKDNKVPVSFDCIEFSGHKVTFLLDGEPVFEVHSHSFVDTRLGDTMLLTGLTGTVDAIVEVLK